MSLGRSFRRCQYDQSEALPLCHVWSDREHGTEVQYPSPLHVPIDEAWSEPQDMEDSQKGGILFRWIQHCWESAGGTSSTVPFYCYNYHTGETYCLRRGRYVSQQELESDIGE